MTAKEKMRNVVTKYGIDTDFYIAIEMRGSEEIIKVEKNGETVAQLLAPMTDDQIADVMWKLSIAEENGREAGVALAKQELREWLQVARDE